MGYLILLLIPLFGGAVQVFMPSISLKYVRLLLVASGGFLFATATTHLLPQLFSNAHYSSMAGFCVALGFLMQLFLEQFSQGIEHGHLHTNHPSGHCHHHDHTQTQQPKVYGGLLLALLIHNFMEGIPLGTDAVGMLQNPLFIGIVAHQAPTAFALMMLLSESKITMRKRTFALVLFAIATPLGVYLGHILPAALHNSEGAMNVILALVTGSFLHISTTIIHEADSNDNHKFNIIKLATAGVGAAAVLLF